LILETTSKQFDFVPPYTSRYKYVYILHILQGESAMVVFSSPVHSLHHQTMQSKAASYLGPLHP